MSKRTKQIVEDNGSVSTQTTGTSRGSLPNFDVTVFSPAFSSKKGAEATIKLEGKKAINLDGRQLKTLYGILTRHFDAVEEIS